MIKNKIGEVYNDCIVIKRDIEREKQTQGRHRIFWLLKCQKCGNILSRRTDNLKTITCKCTPRKHYEQNNTERIQNMIGKKFGLLTVLSYVEKDRAPDGSLLYKCQCSCGNICIKSGTNLRKGTTSCGCLIGSNLKNKPAKNRMDLTGQKFNKITLLKRLDQKDINRAFLYDAKCDCGQKITVSGTAVKNGFIKSCGCLREENLKKYLDTVDFSIDETGKKYGLLTVIKRAGSTPDWKALWECKCDCGNTIIVPGQKLRAGQLSCWCLKDSKEVYKIKHMLFNSHIPFEVEKKYNNCKDKLELPFDFFINQKYIIEFDGKQHFKADKNSYITEDKVKITHKHDLIKNKYCFDNNIPLIRIPYNADYTIDDLKLETTRFLLTPENEKEYYESRSA